MIISTKQGTRHSRSVETKHEDNISFDTQSFGGANSCKGPFQDIGPQSPELRSLASEKSSEKASSAKLNPFETSK